jgi:hypothetical protein
MVFKKNWEDEMSEEKERNKEETVPVQMVIELLQAQNKMIGVFTQTVIKQLKMISADVEMSKVYLGKLVKFGPPEIRKDSATPPIRGGSSIPESESSISSIGG